LTRHRAQLVCGQSSLNQQDRLTRTSDIDLEICLTDRDEAHGAIQSDQCETVKKGLDEAHFTGTLTEPGVGLHTAPGWSDECPKRADFGRRCSGSSAWMGPPNPFVCVSVENRPRLGA
jgi:hypothetical protein